MVRPFNECMTVYAAADKHPAHGLTIPGPTLTKNKGLIGPWSIMLDASANAPFLFFFHLIRANSYLSLIRCMARMWKRKDWCVRASAVFVWALHGQSTLKLIDHLAVHPDQRLERLRVFADHLLIFSLYNPLQ